MLGSKYLDGTLSFLQREMDKEYHNTETINEMSEEVKEEETSNDSIASFEFPPISLLSSDSETESTECSVAVADENVDGRFKQKSLTKNVSTESENKGFKSTETTTGKTIVSLEMIEALLKSKTNSSDADTVPLPTIADDKSDAAIHRSSKLSDFLDQTRVEQPSVADSSTFMQNLDITPSIMMPSHSRNIISTQANSSEINCNDISMEDSNSKTHFKNENSRSDKAVPVNNVKKEITSIFDIDSEGDDIGVFLNEVADYVSTTYSLEQQMDIRLEICDLVTAAEIEEIDEQTINTNITENENIAFEPLSEIKHKLVAPPQMLQMYDLSSDSESSM